MKNQYYLIFISSLILFFAPVADAKKFKIISLDDFEKIEKIRFQDVSTPRNIILKKYHSNIDYTVPVNDMIYFYGIDSETGISSRKPLLNISFADQEEDSIVLLRSKNSDPENISYKFIKYGPDSFPVISAMILNLSDCQVIAKIGSEIIQIQPNSQKLVPLPKDKKGSFNDKVVFAAKRKDQSIDYFHSTLWRVHSGNRHLCIIDFNADTDKYKLTKILL